MGRTIGQGFAGRAWKLGYIEGLTMTTRLRARCFVFVLSVLLATTAASWATDQTITLTVGTRSALLLERPFKTVLIGDPNVVDVVKRDDRSVMFEPLNPGATNVIFIDERSIAIRNVGILVCEADATRIAYLNKPDCVVNKERPQRR
jgi:Flp pilus assembly secretin CpaC